MTRLLHAKCIIAGKLNDSNSIMNR